MKNIQQTQPVNLYEPLPEGEYTRVLILEPGRRRQPLRCQLKIVNLEENPDFEAISYVWGRGIKRKKVICNGARVKITANLLQALLAVRHPSRPRTVWADSISINQNNMDEKGHQVAFMGRIFNRARRVLIHLAGDDKGQAHGVATFVAEQLAMIRQMLSDNPETFPDPSAEEIQLLMEDSRLQGVKNLVDHSWFERGWVVQEALLGQDTVVIWGWRQVFKFESLMIFLDWLWRRFQRVYIKYKVRPLNFLSNLYPYRFREVAAGLGIGVEAQPSFPRILDLAREARVKNQRDRVYAFLYLDGLGDRLNMAKDATSRLAIQPDYSKSVAEVYADFARHCVKCGDIEWLHYVQHTQASLVETGFASWVPRWDVREHLSFTNKPSIYRSIYPSHHTSDDGSQELARFEGNRLIVRGVVFDRVQAGSCHPPAGSRSITLSDVASFWRMARISKLGSAYPPEHLGLALLYTLTSGSYFGSWPEWLEEIEIFGQFLRATEEDPDAAGSFLSRMPRLEHMILPGSGRKLICTDKGYFGLAPRITEENDICCIIFGCCFPFILREVKCPSLSEQQSYRVIGDVWVPGKPALPDPEGGLVMPEFGGEYSKEWETWGLKEGDIILV